MDRNIFEGIGCSSRWMYIRSIADITSYSYTPRGLMESME